MSSPKRWEFSSVEQLDRDEKGMTLRAQLNRCKADIIINKLVEMQGNISRTAIHLGIGRNALERWMKILNIKVRRIAWKR